MDISRLKQLAGVKHEQTLDSNRQAFRQLNEVVQLSDDMSMDDLIGRLDACKRALGIVNKMTDPADRKKWLSATFVNLNKVRGALQRLMSKEGIGDQPEQAASPAAPVNPIPAPMQAGM